MLEDEAISLIVPLPIKVQAALPLISGQLQKGSPGERHQLLNLAPALLW